MQYHFVLMFPMILQNFTYQDRVTSLFCIYEFYIYRKIDTLKIVVLPVIPEIYWSFLDYLLV